jgi:hypothetical protein
MLLLHLGSFLSYFQNVLSIHLIIFVLSATRILEMRSSAEMKLENYQFDPLFVILNEKITIIIKIKT